MIDYDKREFKNLMADTMVIYERELTEPLLRMWWTSLLRFDISDVRAALGRYIQNAKTGKFSPKPADIIGIIETMYPDGRIGVEEAWALYPHNELDSAAVTDEMHEAMQAAKPLLDIGDSIGGRMAFKEAYTRIVERNKFNGIAPKWEVTLGHRVEGRQEAIKQAVELGRISQSQAVALLPRQVVEGFYTPAPIKMITSDEKFTPDQMRANKARLAAVMAKTGIKMIDK